MSYISGGTGQEVLAFPQGFSPSGRQFTYMKPHCGPPLVQMGADSFFPCSVLGPRV